MTLTTRKPPKALEGAPYVVEHGIDLTRLTEPTVIFPGPAGKAIAGFPANVNVAAALSLAGLGVERTEVRILAEPGNRKTIHEIEAEGDFGRLFVQQERMGHSDVRLTMDIYGKIAGKTALAQEPEKRLADLRARALPPLA